ncbi:MAG TPA: glycosyltransferase [Streptosporangiaceae bacterium]|nr:glycosyltransferase [Streptosporangiaceae bacterium]
MSRPLRVAVVITRLEGGAGIQALRGARALDPAAFSITLITGQDDGLRGEAVSSGLDCAVEPALRTPIDPLADRRALARLGSLFRQRRFDVVHTHTAKAGTLGRLAAHRVGVPRIVHTYHGFPFHEFQSLARRRAYVAIERRLGRHTDLALCVGTGVAAEAIRRRLLLPERIATIGVAVEGVGTDAAPPYPATPQVRAKARLALGVAVDATVVGAVGRLTYQKAPEHFVTALRKLGRDVTGVWIGSGELAGRVADQARAAGVRLILPGERADVPALLPAFDVFALPSRYEGLPTAVVEAMVAGVPVVATTVNAVSDVVTPGETGLLVPPQRPELLARAVRYLLDHPVAAARMAGAAHDSIGSRYSEAALADALQAAYLADRPTAAVAAWP